MHDTEYMELSLYVHCLDISQAPLQDMQRCYKQFMYEWSSHESVPTPYPKCTLTSTHLKWLLGVRTDSAALEREVWSSLSLRKVEGMWWPTKHEVVTHKLRTKDLQYAL